MGSPVTLIKILHFAKVGFNLLNVLLKIDLYKNLYNG